MPISNPFRRIKKENRSSLPRSSSSENLRDETQKSKSLTPKLPPGVEPKPEVPKPNILFHAQLAHGSPTVTISGFSNIRELYAKIANAYKIPSTEVLFCTLNTHKCDMEKLLGAQIGLKDMIFCHVKGQSKHVSITKSESALGFTITDNGTGYSFIKRIRDGSVASLTDQISVGDHIAAIDGKVTVGLRHFQVAKILKEIPIETTFTISLITPQKGFDMIAPRSKEKAAVSNNNVGTGKATLRLRSTGPPTLEAVPSESEDQAVKKIDDLLDSFLGIRDMELASTIWESGKGKKNPDEFICALNQQLGDFGFPQEFIFDCWGVVLDNRCKNTF